MAVIIWVHLCWSHLILWLFNNISVQAIIHIQSFKLQPWTKYLRKTQVFMWNSALWENFIFIFSAGFLFFLSLTSFSNLCIPCLLLIIILPFACGQKGICYSIKKFQNIMSIVACKIFCLCLFLFTSLVTVSIVKKVVFLAEIYFIFLKKHAGPNLKAFWYWIWTSVKRSEK